MKKILSLILVLLFLFSFAACSGNRDANSVRGDQQSIIQTSSNTSSTVSAPEFSLGNTDGLVYENKFIGIGCTLNSDWSFYTDEQIKQINNITNDLAGDAYVEAMKDANLIYDMFATSGDQLNNMNVILEKVNPLALAALDIEENLKNAFQSSKGALENMGYGNISYQIDEITVAGKNHKSLYITAEISGIKMYQKTIIIKCNGYLASVSITCLQTDITDSIFSKFYAVE